MMNINRLWQLVSEVARNLMLALKHLKYLLCLAQGRGTKNLMPAFQKWM